MVMPLHQRYSSFALSTERSSEHQYTIGNVNGGRLSKKEEHTCLRSSFLRAISAAFSSFVIPAVPGTDAGEETGDVAWSVVAGEDRGVL
jgi:hypothetical protein